MALVINIDDNRSGYKTVVDAVLQEGARVPSRNGDTLEVRDMVIVLKDPRAALPVGVGRGVKAAIGAVEAAQLVAGVTDPTLTVAIAPNFENFLETDRSGPYFHGAYGPRTKRQFLEVEKKLKADPDSRQAVVTIWDPMKDNIPGKKDYPCTVTHDFLIREGKLHMTTLMRSNDVWWGWAYDAFQFTAVHISMADALQVQVGEYVHHSVSMHLYEQHWTAARKLHEWDGTMPPPAHGFIDAKFPSWSTSAARASYVLNAARDLTKRTHRYEETEAESWYIETMRKTLLK